MIPIVSVVGRSGVGKTTFLEKLILELSERGYRVGTIKHGSHDFDLDRPGKDTWRHAQAGSAVVAFASPHRLAVMRRLERELTIDEIAAMMHDVDIIITEGYKGGHKPKIEVSRCAVGHELVSPLDELITVVTDSPYEGLMVPQFGLEDAAGPADVLVRGFLQDRRLDEGRSRVVN